MATTCKQLAEKTHPAMTVVVVDRDESIRTALGDLLEDEGYAVVEVCIHGAEDSSGISRRGFGSSTAGCGFLFSIYRSSTTVGDKKSECARGAPLCRFQHSEPFGRCGGTPDRNTLGTGSRGCELPGATAGGGSERALESEHER